MMGLLYKDFLCIKGKIMAWLLAIQFMIVAITRIVLRNGGIEADVIIFIMYTSMIGIAFMCIIGMVDTSLMKMERQETVRRYTFSLPVSKRQYVLGKYLFLLIMLYAVLSLGILESMVCQLFCSEGMGHIIDVEGMSMRMLFQMFQQLLIPISGIILFVCGIEFAFMFLFGAEHGIQVKEGLFLLLFFGAMVNAMFGKLPDGESGFIKLCAYMMEHPEQTMYLSSLPLILGGLVYWLSYLLSVHKFEKREM